MANLLHSESKRLCSWLWDSHNSPKNSKWLQDNLTDMDSKVKQMIKLINEDADSFARRAEMYYKKRPELMKLVEEFYRAYRALAERYDHATVELRQAHRTMAEAFPNQIPFLLADDSPSSEPHTPKTPRPIRALLDQVDLYKDVLQTVRKNGNNIEDYDSLTSKKGFKQFCDMLESGETARKSLKFSDENQNLKTLKKQSEDTEIEVKTLKDALTKIRAEKDAVLGQYNQAQEKLSELESELNRARIDAGALDEQAIRFEIEIRVLKEALERLKAERDADLLRYNQCMKTISSLELMISKAQADGKAVSERANKAEDEAQYLKEELSKMEADKEAMLLQHKQSHEKISSLEDKISLTESHGRILSSQLERAETEVAALKQAVARLTEEKEAAALMYQRCLETIAKLEGEISHAHEEAKKLNNKIQIEAAKLRSAEEQCLSLEKSNLSLQEEAESLAQQIAIKDQELLKKQEELEKLQALLQDGQLRFIQVEATLHTLQYVHSQSQEEQKVLAEELKSELQKLKELEICKQSLEEEIHQVKGENQSLSEQNRLYNISVDNLQNEIYSLKAMKEKLEQEFEAQMEHTNALQDEVFSLKVEIKGLNERYMALIMQVESVGLNPECLGSSIKELQAENLQLKETYQKEREEKAVISEKLKSMDKILEEKNVMESSLSNLNGLLQGSEEKIKELQESCQFLQGKKADLVAEKVALLSQLQTVTENMKNLLEKNTLLENSLSESKVELEGLRAKSKGLEEFCQLLRDEKSNLLTERSNLVSQLENVEQRVGKLERRFTTLEEKYADFETEKESTLSQVEQLRGSLSMEKEEHASYAQSTEARLTSLESHIHLLQEENKLRKKEFEVELDRAVNAQVEIFILRKFIRDLEERNMSLFIECQKHIEASKFSDKLISELEDENFEQQVEVEFLKDELAKLRMGIQQVFMALQISQKTKHEDKVERQNVPLPYILNNIEELKSSLGKNEGEKHELLEENSVLLTFIGQLKLDNANFESEKRLLEEKLKVMTEEYLLLQKDKQELVEMNRKLQLDISRGEQQEAALKSEVENLHVKLNSMQQSYLLLQEESSKALKENRSLVKKISDIKKEECKLQEESSLIIQEAVALSNLSLVLEVSTTEKVAQLKALAEDLESIQIVNGSLRKELRGLEERIKMKDIENLHLGTAVQKMDVKLHEITDLNGQLNVQLAVAEDFVKQKEMELLEAQDKLRATQILNLELGRTVEDLKIQCEESKRVQEDLRKHIFELSNDREKKTKEIACLHERNYNLEFEVDKLQKEIEQHVLREENLCTELQKKSSEFELWDAEAATFYFDLQVSAVNEVILKNKLHELKGLHEDLRDESSSKSVEIEQLKGRINSLESEIGGMKAQFSAYVPVVAALRDDVASLEKNALQLTKVQLERDHSQGTETAVQWSRCQEHDDNHGISDLEKLQTRIRAVGKAIADEMERFAKLNASNTSLKFDVPKEKTAELKQRGSFSRDAQREREGAKETIDNLKSRKAKPEVFDVRNGLLMKDIPLDQVSDCSFRSGSRRRHSRVDDQMLELWETAEQEVMVDKPHRPASVPTRGNVPCRPKDARHKSKVPSIEFLVEKELGVDRLELSPSVRKSNKRKILEKLSADSEKLSSLETTLKDLRKKMDMLKRSKKAKDIEYGAVRIHLEEVEEAVLQLATENGELTRDIEKSRGSSWDGRTSGDMEESASDRRRRVTEQARKGSEKIGQLQLEVQYIENLLLKLEDDKKDQAKNAAFSESRTGILLKDIIYSGKRSTRRRRKVRFCGCMRSSSKKE